MWLAAVGDSRRFELTNKLPPADEEFVEHTAIMPEAFSKQNLSTFRAFLHKPNWTSQNKQTARVWVLAQCLDTFWLQASAGIDHPVST